MQLHCRMIGFIALLTQVGQIQTITDWDNHQKDKGICGDFTRVGITILRQMNGLESLLLALGKFMKLREDV